MSISLWGTEFFVNSTREGDQTFPAVQAFANGGFVSVWEDRGAATTELRGHDTIYLDNAAFKKLGKGSFTKPGKLNTAFFKISDKARDKNDYVIYDRKKGVLWYDADGSGKGAAVEISTLSKKLKMSVLDFFVI
ncbi:MAG: hypothetical protein K0S56_4287 [Microvirga sp.]|nr:hypothetical protein [Microvirga sp.]